jgi:hypothetical protein
MKAKTLCLVAQKVYENKSDNQDAESELLLPYRQKPKKTKFP